MEAITGGIVGVIVTLLYVGVFSLGLVPGLLFFPLMARTCRRTAPGWWLVYCLAATPMLGLLMVGLTKAGRSMSGFDPLLPFFFALQLGWCLVAMWAAWI